MFIALRRKPLETASGAILMAMGIFLNGAADRLPLHAAWEQAYSIGLFLIWLIITSSIARTAMQRQLKAQHLTDPIQSERMDYPNLGERAKSNRQIGGRS